MVAGFRFAVLQAAFASARSIPPPQHSGLRFPSPVGHGRGLATRTGCAVPGEGVGSPCLRLRLRPASPTPGERGRSSCQPTGSQPLLALARDSLCLTGVVLHRLKSDRRAPKHFGQYAGPSDNRALCKVADLCPTCSVYSPLRFAYGYIMQAIIRHAIWWRQFPAGSRCAVTSVGFGQVRPLQA